ncbi:MAG: NlpC/P60 family protein [Acidimicrobiales bacterium]
MRRLMVILLTGAMALSCTVLGAGRVGADEIADKQAQAEQISAKLADLDATMEMLGEEYNQARLQLDQVQVDIDDAAKRVDAANRELALRQHELDNYAVAAFMNGGSGGATEALLTGEGPEVGRRIEYLAVASANRRKIIDEVRVAREGADAELAQLQQAKDQAESLQHELDQKRSDTEKASNQQQALLANVNGELLQLVQDAQARQAQQADETVKARLLGTDPGSAPGQPVADPTAPADPSSPTTTRNPTSPTTAPPATTPTTVRPVTPPPPPPGEPPAPLPAAARAVALVMTQLGVPYLWAGSDPEDGFDCSGLIMWAYAGAGKSLPHSSQLMANVTRHIAFTDLKPGDLLFYGSPIHHVGMYVGNGQMIEAPHAGANVRLASIWRSDLVLAGRVV